MDSGCWSCRFYAPHSGYERKPEGFGRCKRHAPAVSISHGPENIRHDSPVWPQIWAEDWCGDWESYSKPSR